MEAVEAPGALTSLKYFAEDRSDVHIAAAGSLLGIALQQDTSFPVGKVNFIDLHPLDFDEFLRGVGEGQLADLVQRQDWSLIASYSSRLTDCCGTTCSSEACPSLSLFSRPMLPSTTSGRSSSTSCADTRTTSASTRSRLSAAASPTSGRRCRDDDERGCRVDRLGSRDLDAAEDPIRVEIAGEDRSDGCVTLTVDVSDLGIGAAELLQEPCFPDLPGALMSPAVRASDRATS